MCFLFINKTLRFNNLKIRTAMILKILMLFVLKQSYICDYIICMTVQLNSYLDNDDVVNFKIYLGSTFKRFTSKQWFSCLSKVLWTLKTDMYQLKLTCSQLTIETVERKSCEICSKLTIKTPNDVNDCKSAYVKTWGN